MRRTEKYKEERGREQGKMEKEQGETGLGENRKGERNLKKCIMDLT